MIIPKKTMLFISLVLFCLVSSVQAAKYVIGTLQEFGPYGLMPAKSIKVSLLKRNPDGRLTGVARDYWTSADGRFSFVTEPGDYILRVTIVQPVYAQINTPEKPVKTIDYGIQVLAHNKGTSLKPIVINMLWFKQPSYIFTSSSVTFTGTCTHIPRPPTAYTWIVFSKTTNDDDKTIYPQKPIVFSSEKTWSCRSLTLTREYKRVYAIMVTETSHRLLLKAAASRSPVNYLKLTAHELNKADIQLR